MKVIDCFDTTEGSGPGSIVSDAMRDLILARLKPALEDENDCDEELMEEFGTYEEIAAFSNEDLLNVFESFVGFRG